MHPSTLLNVGAFGPERAFSASHFVSVWYLDNPLPLPERCAYLCAALERPRGRASSIHATGISLLGQEDELVDVAQIWSAWSEDRTMRRALRATVDLGAGRTLPARLLDEVADTLGAHHGAWQDLLSLACWYDAIHRTHLTETYVSTDPRLDEWLAILVKAARHLPDDYN